MKLDKNQTAAIDAATSNRVSIITGGAGTGKTTIISQIASRLDEAGEEVALCAFAGKAAARLREACTRQATTIHRLLGSNGTRFMRETLEGVSVIVDEASMISSDLMAEIVRRNPARLVLVGDPAQLPPVGRGQPFHDLIALRGAIVYELTTCYRATEAVYQAAHAIRSGATPEQHLVSSGERWDIIATGGAEQTQAKLMTWVESGALDFERDIILCPCNGAADQPCSVAGLNAAIVERIAAHRDKPTELRPGDRVINVKNLPKKDMWNGTTGTVHGIDIDGGVFVKTDVPVIDWDRTSSADNPEYTSIVLLSAKEARDLQHAYALSVHKAQGSQYRRVVFVALNRDAHMLLTRSLVYTAVTRTQEQCAVIGQPAALTGAIAKVEQKRTVLQELAGIA